MSSGRGWPSATGRTRPCCWRALCCNSRPASVGSSCAPIIGAVKESIDEIHSGVALSARGLTKTYGAGPALVRAVDGVDLDVGLGETVSVMGPSGCGKSTLLYLLGGLERATSGEIVLAGKRVDRLSETRWSRLRRNAIGFVF